jgi:hypothetical protein
MYISIIYQYLELGLGSCGLLLENNSKLVSGLYLTILTSLSDTSLTATD